MSTKVITTAEGLKLVEPQAYITFTDGRKSRITGGFGAVIGLLAKYGVDPTPLEMGYGDVVLPTGEVISRG